MKPSSRVILIMWLFAVVLSLSMWIGAVYVVYHFVTKYW
jgi:hypothetical protein